MKKTVFYLVGALLLSIIASCYAKSPKEDKEACSSDSMQQGARKPLVLVQPNDSGIVYKGTLLNHCINGLTTLTADPITDSKTLFSEVRKAIELERGFLKCFNKLHTKSALSNSEKADSMANEAFAEIDSLGETGVTMNMIEYTDKHFYLDRYRELLCYKDLVSQKSSMPSNTKKALIEETFAWHKFFDAVTEFAVQGVRMDFFTGGSMMAIAAPGCVWSAQECRVKSLRSLLYTGFTKGSDLPKDYEKQFIDKVTSRANSLYDTSMLEYISDIEEQKRYKEECTLARTVMLPKVISTLKKWEEKRRTLVYSIYASDNNVAYANDVSAVLNDLTEIIEISY